MGGFYWQRLKKNFQNISEDVDYVVISESTNLSPREKNTQSLGFLKWEVKESEKGGEREWERERER